MMDMDGAVVKNARRSKRQITKKELNFDVFDISRLIAHRHDHLPQGSMIEPATAYR
jgi:hypothetical protein